MTRLPRLTWGLASLAVLVTMAAAFTPSSRIASAPGVAVITVSSIATQLGVKVASGADAAFVLGTGFTGSLEDPEKLAGFGIKGMGVGARVAVARIANDRVLVDADELEPPQRKSVRLRMDENGNLSPLTR